MAVVERLTDGWWRGRIRRADGKWISITSEYQEDVLDWVDEQEGAK